MNNKIKYSDISEFFDEMSKDRNQKIKNNPIVEYEQKVRAATVIGLLSPKKGEKILDIGCGNARDIGYLLKNGVNVIGIDISEGMVSEAKIELEKKGYNNVVLEVGDATNLNYADDVFDKILCSEVIEHIPDAEKALSEMYRVLKPNGILVLSTPNPKSLYGFDRYVVWESILRKKWNHPFDNWRSIKKLLNMTEEKEFKTIQKLGACYVPGFLISYFMLPDILQHLLLKVINMIEPVFAKWLPQFGYMVCVSVKK